MDHMSNSAASTHAVSVRAPPPPLQGGPHASTSGHGAALTPVAIECKQASSRKRGREKKVFLFSKRGGGEGGGGLDLESDGRRRESRRRNSRSGTNERTPNTHPPPEENDALPALNRSISQTDHGQGDTFGLLAHRGGRHGGGGGPGERRCGGGGGGGIFSTRLPRHGQWQRKWMEVWGLGQEW
jgi:hypothetical protein